MTAACCPAGARREARLRVERGQLGALARRATLYKDGPPDRILAQIQHAKTNVATSKRLVDEHVCEES